MMEKKQGLEIEVILNGKVEKQFLEIKRAVELTDDAEVLKLIIKWYFDKYFAKRPR